MSKPEIKIIIDEKGNVQSDAIGFHGNDCEEFQKKLTEALGLSEEIQDKPEKMSKLIITSKNKQSLNE